MKSSFMRPALLLALALGLSGCGGKATYPINVNINKTQAEGLVYFPLVLKDTISGQTLTINSSTATTVSFPNTLEYGTEYNIVAATPAPHTSCQILDGSDVAGRRASIEVQLYCNVQRWNLTGKVTIGPGADVTGLQITNGSDTPNPIDIEMPKTTPAVAPTYLVPNLKYGSNISLTIFRQPSGTTPTVCNLVATPTTPVGTRLEPAPAAGEASKATSAAGTIGDGHAAIDINCVKV
ncbi:hypothetical protein KY495_10605 [Massilia sp. PAMC28688]|uniref:hypothetical protein n=1 Tax=Massilia sp. PAMC28688 TaxID=2861283 RepID=UPI001C62B1BD|nr:hypothetical protein [Massilia sp. PAMC28688]QYF95552.1 hypothetical protein KY495_10605 [Massilia sp. PAMC28688]